MATSVSMVAKKTGSLKKSAIDEIDYFPAWYWYMDWTDNSTTDKQFWQNPKTVNGGWYMDVYYIFELSRDTAFQTIVYQDTLIPDRYNYFHFPKIPGTKPKKWLDTLGTARPLLDTTYYRMKDSAWVVYDVDFYARCAMQWVTYDTVYFWWGDYLPAYDIWYDCYGPYHNPFHTPDQWPWSNVVHFRMIRPLPVELMNLDAVQYGNSIKILWKTATEINCYGFDVQRRIGEGIWETLGFVPGYGTTHIHRTYEFIDISPSITQINYYRLKQIDNTGRFDYSWTVSCQLVTSVGHAYPNPVTTRNSITTNNTLTIPFSITRSGRITLKFYDLKGNTLRTWIDNQFYEVGDHVLSADVTSFSSGIYFYELVSGSNRSVEKVLIIR